MKRRGRVLENRQGVKATIINGYSNFLFLNWDGCPKTAANYVFSKNNRIFSEKSGYC